ncbi:MAG: Ig-like domain-containing protein [Myxococcota bacterium]|nr:Ig-like domain-containing protein [Myxococcota bacterium]
MLSLVQNLLCLLVSDKSLKTKTLMLMGGLLLVTTGCSVFDAPKVPNIHASNDLLILEEDSATVHSLLNCISTKSAALTFALLTEAEMGAVELLDPHRGEFSYTVYQDAYGVDSFVYSCANPKGKTIQATVDIMVNPVNDLPVATSLSFEVQEDDTYSGNFLGSDVDDVLLAYEIIAPPTSGTVTVDYALSDNFVYIPEGEYSGPDSFSYRIKDGAGYSEVASVDISVLPVNDPPWATAQVLSLDEDASVSGILVGVDPEGDTLSFSLLVQPSHGLLTLDAATGVFVYEPIQDFFGQDGFDFIVSDGSVDSEPVAVLLDILPVNDAPSAQGTEISLLEDSAHQGSLQGSDVDADVLSYVLTDSVDFGVLNLNATDGTFTYTPDMHFYGADSFSFKISDGSLSSPEALVALTVTNVNDAPSASDASVSAKAGVREVFTLQGTDIDSETLTYGCAASDLEGSLTCEANGVVAYLAPFNFTGSETFSYTVSDGALLSGAATVSLLVSGDPLSDLQWYLRNSGQDVYAQEVGTVDEDIRGATTLEDGHLGEGTIVAVLDTGLEITHPELSENIVVEGSYNFLNGSEDPTSSSTSGDHGTAVAGIIAARGWNDIGMRGIAPVAKLKGFNFLKSQLTANQVFANGGNPLSADVSVFNKSYGYENTVEMQVNEFLEAQLLEGVSDLRDGKGAVYVKSAGNGFRSFSVVTCIDNSVVDFSDEVSCQHTNMDATRTLPYNMIVAALNADGLKASYSTVGSGIFISAPGGEDGISSTYYDTMGFSLSGIPEYRFSPGVLTTDQTGCHQGYSPGSENSFEAGSISANSSCDYTLSFKGTSAAAPLVSGASAVLLGAYPELTWRDLRHVLAQSARQVDPEHAPVVRTLSDGDYTLRYGWTENAAGFSFHNWYGFGALDLDAAMAMAENYDEDLGDFVISDWQITSTLDLSIPDNSVAGAVATLSFADDWKVESVQIRVDISHGRTGELGIELVSPSGTRSVLAHARNGWTQSNLSNMVLLTHAFYGEDAVGDWRLEVFDADGTNATAGTLTDWALRIFGHGE